MNALSHTHYTLLYYYNLSLYYKDTSINRTLSSVSNVTFVDLSTSEMRTPHYSGHLNMSQFAVKFFSYDIIVMLMMS